MFSINFLCALFALAIYQRTTLSINVESNYMIRLEPVYPALQQYIAKFGPSWSNLTRQDKGQKIVNFLKSETKTAQQPVLKFLKQDLKLDQGLISTFWLFNTIKITNVSHDTLKLLKFARIPGVIGIEKEMNIEAIKEKEPEIRNYTSPFAKDGLFVEVQPNIKKVGAPDVWAAGSTGENILVGIIDSGVRVTHNCLKNNYAGNNGHEAPWYDATEEPSDTPIDGSGSGTHNIGVAVGGCGVGAAPGAQFIACRAYVTDVGTESSYMSCMQYMSCPKRRDQTEEEECGRIPNVVTNSWGIAGDLNSQFDDLFEAWREEQIIGVFAIGNNGPNCGTGQNPAIQEDFVAVGETNNHNILTITSSHGPGVENSFKPELVAPGKAIYSTYNTNDSSIEAKSGTPKSTALVAGGIALLMSYNGTYVVSAMQQLIYDTADKNVVFVKGEICGGDENLNNAYGYGQFNVAKACEKLKKKK